MSSFDPPPSPEWEANPYAAPVAPIGGEIIELDDTMGEAEQVRRHHLTHEASVKSIGSLHFLGAIFGVAIVVAVAFSDTFFGDNQTVKFTIAAIYVLMTAINLALGIGLTKLQVWARWTETALLGIGLVFLLAGMVLQAAVGTMQGPQLIISVFIVLFYVYILYLLLSAKGAMVFSERYRTIIAQTPHIKYRTSIIVKIFGGLLLLLFLIGAIAAAISMLKAH